MQKTKVFYRFGEFRLDAENRLLWRNEELVNLTPKEFDVLFYLVSNAGQVVEKRELLDAVWADTFIEETTLARNVSWLRKKLGDTGEGEQIIRTVPKRGYSFVSEVVKHEDKNALAPADASQIIIEEQTIQRFQIEEIITVADGNDAPQQFPEISRTPLQLNPPSKKRKSKFIWICAGALFVSLVGVILYLSLIRKPVQNVVTVSNVVPFSGLAGREDMPAFSPDGKMLAFVWNGGEGENSDVYVKFIESGEPVRLTKNEASDIRPAFSPDGKQIAFLRAEQKHTELLLIPALGGGERRVCNLRRTSSSISFSPDGRFIAVHEGDDKKRPGVFLVNVDNGEKKRLTEPPDLTTDDRPAFSPDGKQIAFIRSYGQQRQEIFTVSADGGDARQITFDNAWIGGAAWSADGKKLVFASLRKYNSQANIWQIEVNQNNAQPELIATGGKRLANPAMSPDKRTIAFVEETYNTNIWRLEMKEIGHYAERKFAPSSFNDNSPNISPDGKRVVFASNRTGKYDLWITDADGLNLRQLTDVKNALAGSPRFSPDGKQVVFDAQLNGNSDIYIVSADGGSPRRLTDAPSTEFMPSWSADGKSIYFVSDKSGAAQIYKMSSDGGEAKQITQNGGRESYESYDGNHLYYSKEKDTKGLWRVSTKGGDEQPVNELAEVGAWRYWTMAQTGIYYVERSDYAPFKIMFYDFAANRTTEITTTDAPPIWVYPGLSVSGDGKIIFYTKSGQNSSSIMLAHLEE